MTNMGIKTPNVWDGEHERLSCRLTLCVELCCVFAEVFEEHLLPQQLQEGREGGRRLLVVVHLLLCALARSAQQNTHLVLLTQLQEGDTITITQTNSWTAAV